MPFLIYEAMLSNHNELGSAIYTVLQVLSMYGITAKLLPFKIYQFILKWVTFSFDITHTKFILVS